MSYSFDGKAIFISGGCGSLGSSILARLLKSPARRIVVFDNDESKLAELERWYSDRRIRFFVGDVRDRARLTRALEGCQVAFHCAALKIIPICEYNPTEPIKTNILGSQNFTDACLDTVPEIAVGVSTDKACSPLNLYGATKLCMERLFIATNRMKGDRKTIFTCVRYGNVFGSAESVIPVWRQQAAATGKITVTDPEMTRFSITMDQAIDFIFTSMSHAKGSEIFVPKLKSYTVRDLSAAFLGSSQKQIAVEQIGTRVGEKDHEMLINEHEMAYVRELPFGYVISTLDGTQLEYPQPLTLQGLSSYSSETAPRLTIAELSALLANERLTLDRLGKQRAEASA
jgi:UDP-N-acetylglucosamine 4,6-dehydratase/UDP-glucose 4-epimerase